MQKNLFEVERRHLQQRFSSNLLCGLSRGKLARSEWCLIEPYFCKLHKTCYPCVLKISLFATRGKMWRSTWRHLYVYYRDDGILKENYKRRSEYLVWPTRSPDFHNLKRILWNYVSRQLTRRYTTGSHLLQYINKAAFVTRNKLGRMRFDIKWRGWHHADTYVLGVQFVIFSYVSDSEFLR